MRIISTLIAKFVLMKRLKKLKKIRIHHEGTGTLISSLLILIVLNTIFYFAFDNKLPFYIVAGFSAFLYTILVNFFRCPIRYFEQDTEKVVVAPADGKIVVIEEVDENEYFHDKRLMISIFMSPLNVHANWYPVDGVVKEVRHENGKFHRAFLPKASTDKGSNGAPNRRCYGPSHRDLCQAWRGVLHRPAFRFYQTRFAC